jgi:hypothetical protein
MDNAVILGTNGDDLNAIETLRRDAINANENENGNENNTALQTGETDSVELSEESVILSGLNTDNLTLGQLSDPLTRAVEDTSLETETANRIPEAAEANPENTIINVNPELTETLAAANEPETGTEINVPAGTTGITAAEEIVTGAVETLEAAEEEANITTERPENVPFTSRTEETAAGLVEETRETEPLEEAENLPEETAVPLEVQANRLSQLNAALNNANTFTEGAAVTNTEGAPEAQQNEQQTLLQNVGSQLAQVIPPSSILSVVG